MNDPRYPLLVHQLFKYRGYKAVNEFNQVCASHNAQHQVLDPIEPVPKDSFSRITLLSGLQDRFMATLPLHVATATLGSIYPSTVRVLTDNHHFYLTSRPFTQLEDTLFGEYERLYFKYCRTLEKVHYSQLIALCREWQMRYLKVDAARLAIEIFPLIEALYTKIPGFGFPSLNGLTILKDYEECMSLYREHYLDDRQKLVVALRDVLPRLGSQLRRLTINYFEPWIRQNSPAFPITPCLVALQVSCTNEAIYGLLQNYLLNEKIISLHMMIAPELTHHILPILDRLPALHKLALEYPVELGMAPYTPCEIVQVIQELFDVNAAELKWLNTGGKKRLEVLSLALYRPQYLLEKLRPYFGSSVKELRLKIYLEQLDLDLAGYPAVRILRLNATQLMAEQGLFANHINALRQLTCLTVVGLSHVSQTVLTNLGLACPKLFELNIGALFSDAYNPQFSDDQLAVILASHFPFLRTFRFTDSFRKFENDLNHSIRVLLERAENNQVRVTYQVPASNNVRDNLNPELRDAILKSHYFQLC